MTPLTKGVAVLLGLPLLLGIIFFYYFISSGESRMRATCAQVQAGITYEQLVQFTKEHNLTSPSKGASVVRLSERRNFGQHACNVALDAGIVKSAEYGLSD